MSGQGARFSIGQLGARLVDRHLIVAGIELDQHGSGIDELVVFDCHPCDRAAYPRGDLRDVRVHLRIVGRDAAGGEEQPETDTREREDHHPDPQTDA